MIRAEVCQGAVVRGQLVAGDATAATKRPRQPGGEWGRWPAPLESFSGEELRQPDKKRKRNQAAIRRRSELSRGRSTGGRSHGCHRLPADPFRKYLPSQVV